MVTHSKLSVVSPEIAPCTRNWKATSANPNLRTISSRCRDARKYLPSSQAPYGPELVALLTGFRNDIVIFVLIYWRQRCYEILKDQVGK